MHIKNTIRLAAAVTAMVPLLAMQATDEVAGSLGAIALALVMLFVGAALAAPRAACVVRGRN